MKRVAVVIDVRGGNNLSNFYDDLTDFKKEHKAFSLMFLDAREDVIKSHDQKAVDAWRLAAGRAIDGSMK